MSHSDDPKKPAPARTLIGRPIKLEDLPPKTDAEAPAEPNKLPGVAPAPVVIPAGAESTMPMGSSSLREALNAALAAGPEAMKAQMAVQIAAAGQSATEGTDATTVDTSPPQTPNRGASIAAALANVPTVQGVPAPVLTPPAPPTDPIAALGAQMGVPVAVSTKPGSQPNPATDPIAALGAQMGVPVAVSTKPGSQPNPQVAPAARFGINPGSQPGIAPNEAPRAHTPTGSPLLDRTLLAGSPAATAPLGSPAMGGPQHARPGSQPGIDRTQLAGSTSAGSQPGIAPNAHLERTMLAGAAPTPAQIAQATEARAKSQTGAPITAPSSTPLAGTPLAPDSMFARQKPPTNPNQAVVAHDPTMFVQGAAAHDPARAKPPTGPNPAVAPYTETPRIRPPTGPNLAAFPGATPNDATMMAGPQTAIEPMRDRVTTDPMRPMSTEALREIPNDLYEVGQEIARGGMGRILQARDVRLRREVAIKELLGNNAMFKARFEREALITARLQHPAIVPIYEAGRWPTGELFYTMKLVSGRPLEQIIMSIASMRERLALLPNIIAVAEALAYAHSRNVVHRDLKPANVLVGDFGETIVIDWGLAKDLSTNEAAEPAGPFRTPAIGSVGATVAGSVMGTPAYMPPEQGKGQQVDARADVYAIGAVLYHVLGRRAPYDGPDGMSILQAMLKEPPPTLASIAPDVPRELATIVEKAMARDPAQRYPTARELVEDLRRFQNGQMVGVHRYTSRELFKRWAKKHKGALAVASAAIVVLAVIGVIAISRVVSANREAQRQRDEALSQQKATAAALARAEESEGRAKKSEREVAIERDRARFARERRVEFDHFTHTQRVKACVECHPTDPATFSAKVGAPGHAECRGCHDPKSMEGMSNDPKCAFCHIDRVATTKDHSSLRACDDNSVRALKSAGGKTAPCFRHDRKEHRLDDKGQPLDCTNCHGLLADKTKWGTRSYVTLHDLDTNTIIGLGPQAGIDVMHKACTTGCHAHEGQTGLGAGATNCSMCHPKRDAF